MSSSETFATITHFEFVGVDQESLITPDLFVVAGSLGLESSLEISEEVRGLELYARVPWRRSASYKSIAPTRLGLSCAQRMIDPVDAFHDRD